MSHAPQSPAANNCLGRGRPQGPGERASATRTPLLVPWERRFLPWERRDSRAGKSRLSRSLWGAPLALISVATRGGVVR